MLIFREKPLLGCEKQFSNEDLIKFVADLIKDLRAHEMKSIDDNYSWLRSKKSYPANSSIYNELSMLKPMIDKMVTESCAVIAVKLDSYTEVNVDVTVQDVLRIFGKLLDEQYNLQTIEKSLKDLKIKSKNKARNNKVRPELLPPRLATVSFLLEDQ